MANKKTTKNSGVFFPHASRDLEDFLGEKLSASDEVNLFFDESDSLKEYQQLPEKQEIKKPVEANAAFPASAKADSEEKYPPRVANPFIACLRLIFTPHPAWAVACIALLALLIPLGYFHNQLRNDYHALVKTAGREAPPSVRDASKADIAFRPDKGAYRFFIDGKDSGVQLMKKGNKVIVKANESEEKKIFETGYSVKDIQLALASLDNGKLGDVSSTASETGIDSLPFRFVSEDTLKPVSKNIDGYRDLARKHLADGKITDKFCVTFLKYFSDANFNGNRKKIVEVAQCMAVILDGQPKTFCDKIR